MRHPRDMGAPGARAQELEQTLLSGAFLKDTRQVKNRHLILQLRDGELRAVLPLNLRFVETSGSG